MKKKLSRLAKAKLDENSRYWKKKALEMWSLCVRARDKKCLICGILDNLDAHHVISAMNLPTRFMTLNGVTVCKKHHKFSNEISFHKQSFVAFTWLLRNRPDQFSWLTHAITIKDVETFKQAYERLVKEYGEISARSSAAPASSPAAVVNSLPDSSNEAPGGV